MRRYPQNLLQLALFAALASALHPKQSWAPVPQATLNLPGQAPLGASVTFTLSFDNTGSATGYGPYIDLFLPESGADGTSAGGPNDGITFTAATYLGVPVAATPLPCPAGGSVSHPLTGQPVNCPAQPPGLFSPFQWQLVVLTLPFGSFVPTQPPVDVIVQAQVHNYADAGVALPIWANAGFRYGADPLDNPGSDPPIVGTPTSGSTTPSVLVNFQKQYNGPEDETASGHNFPRQYTIAAVLAPGQTVNNFVLTDTLPSNVQFANLVGTSPAAACVPPSTTVPGGTLICTFASVTGAASVTFEFYVPYGDASSNPVIDPVSGDDALACNQVTAVGDWVPLDPRDTPSPGNVVANPAGCEHSLTAKSIAIQKSVAVVGGGNPQPGAVLEYTLTFQVSDFFVFANAVVSDVISDGQRFDPSFPPTLTFFNSGGASFSGPFAAAHYDVNCHYTGAGTECESNTAPLDGTTTLVFRVSDQLGGTGALIGGCVPPTGTGGPPPNCGLYNDGPTYGTIVFRTVIQEAFSDNYPSGDPWVNQNDIFTNNVTISGAVLAASNLNPTGQTEDDSSQAQVQVPTGSVNKSIYAVNGNTSLPPLVLISPGDVVTFRITYPLPTSDFEDLSLTDYLPLPVFDATEVTSFSNIFCGVPVAGASCLGPGDSYHLVPGAVVPTLSTNPAANSLVWTYGDFNAPAPVPSTIDILFSVTVSNAPFADGLYLTNQVLASEGGTNTTGSSDTGIIQVQLQEPAVAVSKGVVWTNNPNGAFSPSPVGPVTFSPGCPAFSGTITSAGLLANPVNSNLSGVDAGDQVMMAIVLENTGRSSAFDVRVRDSLPPGMTLVPGSLCVTDGTGAPMTFTDLGGGLFGSGIELDDPGPTNPPAGALDPGTDSNGNPINTGRNIAVITYLVTLNPTVQVGNQYTNTATLFNYAGTEGGPDHTTEDEQETASVTVGTPALAKAIVGTNQSFTSGTNVAVGELVTYSVIITVPEGVTPNALFSDTLDPGLAIVSCDNVTASSALSATAGFTCTNALVLANPGGVNEPGEANGRVLSYNFGNITNSDTDNSTPETITIQYTAVVLNSASINDGWVRANYAGLFWSGGSQTANMTQVSILEPRLQITKTASPTSVDAGDVVTYTVTISHAPGSATTAFEAHLRDDLTTLPVTLNLASIVVTPSGCSPTVLNNSTPSVLDVTLDQLPLGCTVSVSYQVTINNTVYPGLIISNTANLDWTSLPGNVSSPQSPYNTLSCERSGNPAGCGGVNNDYVATSNASVLVTISLTKDISETSEASTGPQSGTQRLVVGEIVRYRLQVRWPEGSSVNAMLRDNLPGGLQFLNDNTAKVAFVCNSGPVCMSSSNPLIGSGPVVPGNQSNVASIIPSFVLPDDAVSAHPTTNNDTYGSGTDPYFKLGDFANNDNDPDEEFVVVEFNALVLNQAGNAAGTIRSNNFSVLVGGVARGTSGNRNLVIAEPKLSLAKVITTAPADAGDPVVYTLTITNISSGVNRATAFDLELTDVLDTNLVPGSVLVGSTQGLTCTGPSGAGTTPFSTGSIIVGQTVTVTATCLDPAKSITVTINATVAASAPAGATIPNAASVTWTSLPGPNGASPNPTGSVTPGSPGSTTGERNGQDGPSGTPNNYAATSLVQSALGVPSINKMAANPGSAPIGGLVTFPILITLPEGTTQSLVVVDDLPVGLVFTGFSVATTVAASGGILSADFNGTLPAPTVVTTGGSGDDVTFNFGNAAAAADNVTNNNAFVIFVQARVNNEAGNQNGSILTNFASGSYLDPDTGATVFTDPVGESVSVVEPELALSKTVSNPNPTYGETLTYTLNLSHLASSTAPAFDIQIADTVPAGLTYVPGSITPPIGWTASDAAAPALLWTCTAPCSLPVGNAASFTYQATVNGPPGPPYPGDVLPNTATATWTSLDGADPNERTGAGGLNEYASSGGASVTLSSPDLAVTKDDGQTSYTPGVPLVYTIVVTNVGNAGVLGATFSDPIPPQIASWSWSCTPTGGATCTGSGGPITTNFTDTVDLPAGSTITYTVTAQVSPSAAGPIVNLASVAPPAGVVDPVSNNDAASDTNQQLVEPIPTLSQSGIFLLALVLAWAAIWLLARKLA